LEGQLFLNKTGFEMFDALRAFGLAYLVKNPDDITDIRIQDLGHLYLVSTEGKLPSNVNPQLFVDNDGWGQVFQTVRERKDAKKKFPRKDVEEILSTEYQEILKTHSDPGFHPVIGNVVKDGRAIYQSIDVSAAKGFREEKKGVTYHEGSQLYTDKHSWAIACIGSVFFNYHRVGSDFILNLVPNPTDVWLIQHRQIRDDLSKENICNISANVALAHYSVKMASVIARRKAARSSKYDSIIFNVMRRTGQQPKPGGGGKFGLSLMEQFLQDPAGFDALEKIDIIMSNGYAKGIKQELTFSFAEFIIHPSLRTFIRCEDLYIRARISKNVMLWDKKPLEVLLKNVQDV